MATKAGCLHTTLGSDPMQIIGPAEQLCAPPLAGQPATARWRTASKDERRRVAGGPQRAVAGTCGPTAVGVAPAWIVYMYTEPGGSGVGRSRQVCAASTAAARLQVRAAAISRGAWDFQVAPARARRPASKGGKVVPVACPSGTPPAAPGRFPQLPRQRRLRSRPTKTVAADAPDDDVGVGVGLRLRWRRRRRRHTPLLGRGNHTWIPVARVGLARAVGGTARAARPPPRPARVYAR